MAGIGRLAGRNALYAFGVVATLIAGPLCPARAADIHFLGGQDGTDNSWSNPANWSSNPALPGKNDNVTLDVEDPDFGVNGAIINDGEAEKINALVIDTSLNVLEGGQLTVANGVTNNGPGYFVNEGLVTVKTAGGGVGTITNTYIDDNLSGYIGNTGKFKANLDNSGVVINGSDGSENNHVVWVGNISNSATGAIINTNNATWQGDVTDNAASIDGAGSVYNQVGSTWKGDVVSNSGNIVNDGSVWKGDVEQNTDTGVIENVDGGRWQGDVDANSGSIDNAGGVWTGDVFSNTGAVFNTADSVWNGDMTSSGDLWLSGVVDGSIINNGGTVHVYDPLSGVTSFANNGGVLDMDDGKADGTFSAQSWSGTGTQTAYFDFAPALGKSDHVVLSGDYSADTDINLSVVGSAGRTLGDIPLVLVGGIDSGTVTVSGLPDNGVISYRLAETNAGWVIASSVNDAPSHVADAVSVFGDAVALATQLPLDNADACSSGGWVKALGATHAGQLSGLDSDLGFGGVELGYDFPCLDVGTTGARIAGGLIAGGIGGNVAARFSGDDSFTAGVGEGFVGAYGRLAAGPLHAVLQGQVGLADYGLADPGALVTSATVQSTRVDLSGRAGYDFSLGAATLTPEVGFAAAEINSRSTDFADVATMGIENAPTLGVHVGAKLAGNMTLGDGATTVSPFASVAFHDALVSPGTAAFTDAVGNNVEVAVSQPGSYVALGVGADLLRRPGPAGASLDGGLRANLDYGPGITDTSVSAHLQLQF